MDFEAKKRYLNPYAKANPISKLLFLWIIPLFLKGAKKPLEPDDLYDPLDDDLSAPLGNLLQRNWDKQLEQAKLKGTKPSLLKALIASFGKRYILIWVPLGITECVFRILQSLCLRELVVSFSDENVKRRDQYLLAGGVTLSTLITTLWLYPSMYQFYRTAMKCRIACSSLVYRKALRLSKAAQNQTSIGQFVAILSNDSNRFDLNLVFIPYFILGPIQMGIFIYFLWVDFGVSTLAGISVVLILIPVQYWNGKLSTQYRRQIASKTDHRGKILNEIIISIRVIKMYAWELPFSAMINLIRSQEIKFIRKRSYLRGVYLSIYSSTAKLVPFLTFLAFVLSGNVLSADKVFFLVSVYNTIIQSCVYIIPSAVSGLGEIMVSVKRIQDFLLLEEKTESKNVNWTSAEKGSCSVTLSSATSSWTGEKPNINDMNMNVSGNKVVVIVGPVGSGKTTLLHTLLGELPITSGNCTIRGNISYASQEPWIFAGNIRQNILFGLPFDEFRYNEVVAAAALIDDFKQLQYGELTIVGDRGVSLSGGQKARINLARCLYQKADIYLMDDPLSAVDTKVSRHLFEKCIGKHLDGHLRILVTHQLQYLPQADHIIVMNDGKVLAQGQYEELVDQGVDFVSLMATDSDETATRKESVVPQETIVIREKSDDDRGKPETQTEAMSKGSIGFGLYWEYFKTAKANVFFLFLCIVFVMTQGAMSAAEFWLSFWTNAEAKKTDGDEEGYLGQSKYLYVYGAIVAVVLAGNLGRAIGFFNYTTKISLNIHNRMFASCVRSKIRFFDENPSGRILNRFSKDLSSLDELLPPVGGSLRPIISGPSSPAHHLRPNTFSGPYILRPTTFSDPITFVLNGVIAMVITANYYMAIPAVIILIFLWLLRRFYVKTARAVKRIEGIAKSPLFTHSSATFQGLTTIRAAKAENKLIGQFDGYQDFHSSAWFLFFSTARCFGVWVEMVSIIFLAIVTFGFLLLQESSMGGNVGLAVSSAMSLTGWFQYGMKQSAEVENQMTSVERCLEFASLTPEAPLESTPDKKPPKDWPKGGQVKFQSVSLAYGEKDVLKNVTFDIKANEKIGIVGRTGAGKSTILQALFRMTEPRGLIYIDGICINEIGLHDLRKAISIIPQDPVLFSGTVRYNLDPFDQFKDDATLWEVLEDVELKDAVPALDYQVADGGSNFSVGQRQLVCLARAILRKNRILVLDEATANIDPRTDNFIQETIRSKFADCTIVTIAHRLNSVIDCDRILVLDNGSLLEYDHPHVLLQNENGALTSMVGHTGNSSAAMLKRIAAETYNGRRASFQAQSVEELQSISVLNNVS